MKKIILLFTCLAAFGWQQASAKSVRVNNNANTGAQFTVIEAAIAAVAPGDTIYLEGSATKYTLPGLGKKVTIIGPGYWLDKNLNTLASKLEATVTGDVTIAPSAAGAVIEGVVFENSVYIAAPSVIIRRCYICQVVYFGIRNTTSKDPINKVTITQCYFDKFIDGRMIASDAVITNNIFEANGAISLIRNSTIEYNTFFRGFKMSQVNGCIIRNNILFGSVLSVTASTGVNIANNYDASTADFVSDKDLSFDGKCRLTDYSPAMTAGSKGDQVGAFGGTTPYILSGLSDVPHIYDVDAPMAASPASGLKVTVKVKTEK